MNEWNIKIRPFQTVVNTGFRSALEHIQGKNEEIDDLLGILGIVSIEVGRNLKWKETEEHLHDCIINSLMDCIVVALTRKHPYFGYVVFISSVLLFFCFIKSAVAILYLCTFIQSFSVCWFLRLKDWFREINVMTVKSILHPNSLFQLFYVATVFILLK